MEVQVVRDHPTDVPEYAEFLRCPFSGLVTQRAHRSNVVPLVCRERIAGIRPQLQALGDAWEGPESQVLCQVGNGERPIRLLHGVLTYRVPMGHLAGQQGRGRLIRLCERELVLLVEKGDETDLAAQQGGDEPGVAPKVYSMNGRRPILVQRPVVAQRVRYADLGES